MVRQTRALKSEQREQRRNKQTNRRNNASTTEGGYGKFVPNLKDSQFKPLNSNQSKFCQSILVNVLTFANGPAGTGKSMCAIGMGCQMMKSGCIERIICLKPDVSVGNKLGILPGNKDDKLTVLYNPMRQIFVKLLGNSHFENLFKNERIIFEHLGSILGMTYENALVIIDESQHSTPDEMRVLLTRLGKNSKVIVAGDFREQQLALKGLSGMEDALRRLGNKENVGVIEFTPDDIVRSDCTKQVILAYRETQEDIS